MGPSFYFMGALLLFCVFWLVSRLKKKIALVSTEVEKANFSQEMCTLWTILFTFSITYIIRGFYDQMNEFQNPDYFYQIIDIALYVLFDYVPIMLILMFHFKNFSEKKVNGILRMAVIGRQ